MARAPHKTCPSLYRVFNSAEPELLASFLDARAFERLGWLDEYRFEPGNRDRFQVACEMLQHEKKDRLGPLETEAARIVTIAGSGGQFALEGLARTTLASDRMTELFGQRDELARSLWTFINESALFDAAENTLHLRLYRRYDKHYQTFLVEPAPEGRRSAERSTLDTFLKDLGKELDRGQGYAIDRFDVPAQGEDPAAEMYLLFHPKPPTSVREIDDAGNRTRIYFRPPGEAMIVYTPSTGQVHVRAGTRTLRHEIARIFTETVLDYPLSQQPVDFQAYDISRFFTDFELEPPVFEDAVILRAQVIQADVSIGNLANRLSLVTTINQDLATIIEDQPGLGRIFERAVAVRLIEIAVRYRRVGQDSERTLDFTLTDRNTSSLLSLDDPFERVLGHRLLRTWGILQEGRAPSEDESRTAMPALLALWDMGGDRVTGAWLQSRGIDYNLLTELGFLLPVGWEEDELIDDDDGLGPMAAKVVPGHERTVLSATEGQVAPGGSPDRYRVFRVRDGWVAQHLREHLVGILDSVAVEELNTYALALGTLQIDGRDVPVYLVRGLSDERARAATDTEMRARQDRGIGLVLQAGDSFGSCLAANVLTPVIHHIGSGSTSTSFAADSLKTVFRRNRSLALGGQTVDLRRTGENAGTLFVPGKGTIGILGENRLLVVERLVDAHNNGPAPMATADLIMGIEGQSLANIFGQSLWNKLKTDFIRSASRGLWEIAT